MNGPLTPFIPVLEVGAACLLMAAWIVVALAVAVYEEWIA